jgi:hypothetical protein
MGRVSSEAVLIKCFCSRGIHVHRAYRYIGKRRNLQSKVHQLVCRLWRGLVSCWRHICLRLCGTLWRRPFSKTRKERNLPIRFRGDVPFLLRTQPHPYASRTKGTYQSITNRRMLVYIGYVCVHMYVWAMTTPWQSDSSCIKFVPCSRPWRREEAGVDGRVTRRTKPSPSVSPNAHHHGTTISISNLTCFRLIRSGIWS